MISFDFHIGWFILAGVALLAKTVLPKFFQRAPLSLPIVYIALGYGAFSLSSELFGPRPLELERDNLVIEYATELIVIVSLVGAGLKIERRPGLTSWSSVWRLLAIAMVLTVLATFAGASALLGLALAPAVLLAGVLAPTDPVLAGDVQVSAPGEDHERDEVRFTLTAEAGLNDALAFPFIHLSLALVGAGSFLSVAGEWLAIDVLYRVVVGAGIGMAMGWLLSRFGYKSGEFFQGETSEGLFVLGATLLVYGATEMVNGYGFLAVFVAALVRHRDDETEDYRWKTHSFADQFERILLAFLLLGFGALLTEGILDGVRVIEVVFALVMVLVVRPILAYVALSGSDVPGHERTAIAFFGIKGMGSLYYLAYAASHADYEADGLAMVWRVTALTVLVSAVIHGVTVSPLMRRVDRLEADNLIPSESAATQGSVPK